MNDSPCVKEGAIASLIEKVRGLTTRQDRHHKWINEVERDCRAGREDVNKNVEDKFEKVMEAIGKTKTAMFRMLLTIVLIFGTLLGAIAFLMANGK